MLPAGADDYLTKPFSINPQLWCRPGCRTALRLKERPGPL